jgi:hypothetical protein
MKKPRQTRPLAGGVSFKIAGSLPSGDRTSSSGVGETSADIGRVSDDHHKNLLSRRPARNNSHW